MLISDKIYGDFEITEPVLLELIDSQALQRLKGISQFGPPEEFYDKPVFSRYAHSIGVMLLLRKLGANLEDQAAGLLHDVSHTAFSHVIDFVCGDPIKEDYQDSNHLKILEKSDAAAILKKYNFDLERIADLESHILLDREIPNLCADRIDYFLRELAMNGAPASDYANDLHVFNKKIIFKNWKLAKQFSTTFLEYNREHWTGFEAVTRYHQLSLILKEALNKRIIKFDDFWQDDAHVINKIYASKDGGLISRLEQMKEKKTSIRFNINMRKKFRFIDPEILQGNDPVRLSAIDSEYVKMIDDERQKNAAGITI